MSDEFDGKKKVSAPYLLYPATATEAQVREGFVVKRGHEPKEVKLTGGGWIAGPITEQEGGCNE